MNFQNINKISLRNKLLILAAFSLLFFFLSASTINAQNICSCGDGDFVSWSDNFSSGNFNLSTRSTCTITRGGGGSSSVGPDACVSTTSLLEYACTIGSNGIPDGNYRAVTDTCPGGQVCSNGACIASTPSGPVASCSGMPAGTECIYNGTYTLGFAICAENLGSACSSPDGVCARKYVCDGAGTCGFPASGPVANDTCASAAAEGLTCTNANYISSCTSGPAPTPPGICSKTGPTCTDATPFLYTDTCIGGQLKVYSCISDSCRAAALAACPLGTECLNGNNKCTVIGAPTPSGCSISGNTCTDGGGSETNRCESGTWLQFTCTADSCTPVPEAMVSCGTTPPPPSTEGGGLMPACTGELRTGTTERACTFCDFLTLITNVVDFAIFILAPLFTILMTSIGAFYMIISRGNPGQFNKGKGIITWAFVGYAIVLVAWLIVNTILTLIGAAAWVGIGQWWAITC